MCVPPGVRRARRASQTTACKVQGPGGAGIIINYYYYFCLNVPNGFVSEVPHCSRDLELTGTASSFISVGMRSRLGGVEPSVFAHLEARRRE